MNEFAEPKGAFLIVIELQEPKFGWSDSGANKFVDIALIFGIEKKLSVLANVLLELFFELNNVLKDEFFLGSIFSVGDSGSVLVFVVMAALQFLIDHIFPLLEVLKKFVVLMLFHD